MINVMDVNHINQALLAPDPDLLAILPHLRELQRAPFAFEMAFGLDELPAQPGFLAIRGPRQYGKSTWLEQQIADTVQAHGPGSALYMNGDEIASSSDLRQALGTLVPLLRPEAGAHRIFIDEITAVDDWQRAVKAAADAGEISDVLLVTTGSRAADLRRGTERLPGRKGKLERTSYLFTPVSFSEFQRVCGAILGDELLTAYLLSGGSPVALGELASTGRIPEYVIEMTRDWILGECAAEGRDRASLLAVLQQLHRLGASPVGQAKLAREAGLANNTVAQGYIELLADLTVVATARAWDPSRRVAVRRKRAKFPFTNLLAAVAWAPEGLRSLADFEALDPAAQGRWWEWLVAQELWRRAAIAGEAQPEELLYWQSSDHEIDYVLAPDHFLEVKAGAAGPLEWAWFARRFPRAELEVITTTPFEAQRMRGRRMEAFLLEADR